MQLVRTYVTDITCQLLCQERKPFGLCIVYNAHEVRSSPEATNKWKLHVHVRNFLDIQLQRYVRSITMNSISLESATKFGSQHNSKHKILVGPRPCRFLTSV